MSLKHHVVRLRDRGTVLGTRSLGAEVADEIRASDPGVGALIIDFGEVRVASSPFLDEIVCAVRSTIADNPDRYVVSSGLNEDVLDTVQLVAERRGIALAVLQADTLHVIGGKRHLEETLAAAQELGSFTAPQLAERLELKLPNLHQRLLQLQNAGVITRTDDTSAERGRRLLFGTPDPGELAKSLC
ncbi:MAG: hypothetical protein WKF96_08175 [Solirubrobacteraceae bacterium]